jgi:hypothetical protein
VHGYYRNGTGDEYAPEGGLAIGTLLGNGGSSRLTRSGTLEGSTLSGTGHGSVGRSRGTGSGGRVLVGERIEVLERHLEKRNPKKST